MTSDVGISQDGHKGSEISKQQSWGRTGCLQAAAAHVARWRGDQHRTLLCRCQLEKTTEMVLVSEEFSEIFVFSLRYLRDFKTILNIQNLVRDAGNIAIFNKKYVVLRVEKLSKFEASRFVSAGIWCCPFWQ